MNPLGLLCLTTFYCFTLSHAKVIQQGFSVEINNVPYYVHPESTGELSDCSGSKNAESTLGFVPTTIVDLEGQAVSKHTLSTAIDAYLARDDVFNTGFLEGEDFVMSRLGLLSI